MAEEVATPGGLLGLFLKIGLSSFGGGTTTIMLMQRELVERRHWLTPEQFAVTYSLSKITPGINILAHTILIGKVLAGWRGIAASLIGLLAPAAALTVALSAAYIAVRDVAVVTAAMRGVVPATAGMTLALAITMWPRHLPPRQVTLVAGEAVIAAGAFLLLALAHLQVPLVLAAGGAAGAFLWAGDPRRRTGGG